MSEQISRNGFKAFEENYHQIEYEIAKKKQKVSYHEAKWQDII